MDRSALAGRTGSDADALDALDALDAAEGGAGDSAAGLIPLGIAGAALRVRSTEFGCAPLDS